eukprot:Platyproteum_vivax@DN5766_c0_g1_i1.p1
MCGAMCFIVSLFSLVAVLDAAHQVTEKVGLVFCGSAVYIVVGSSSIIWTAVLARVALAKRLTRMQWCALCFIVGGLALRATALEISWQSNEFVGVVLTLIAAILHACTFVANEKLLTGPHAISGPSLVGIMGTINLLVLVGWSALYTIPNFSQLILRDVYLQNGSWLIIALCMCGIYLAGFIHSNCLWMIILAFGSVTAGVTKGLKTAVVAFLCHYLFCPIDQSQCLTPWKLFSALVCGGGVVLYAVGKDWTMPLRVLDEAQNKEVELAAVGD